MADSFHVRRVLLLQIFRQELENRRAAIQHQQQQYGEGQELDAPSAATSEPTPKRQRTEVEEAPAAAGHTAEQTADSPRGRRSSSDEDD